MATADKGSFRHENGASLEHGSGHGHGTPDAAQERELFATAFASLASGVARPLFERFANIAMRRGFAAVVKEQVDGDNNPSLQLRFIPERGGRLGLTSAGESTGECVFALTAHLAERMVEHAACHDQRKGWGGMAITRSGLQSINHEFLEAGLEQFLRCALEASQSARAQTE